MNFCTTCGQDFSSVGTFDRHRVGKYLQEGPTEYRDRIARGLVPPPSEEPWDYETSGRRCLDIEEMRALGWEIDKRGRWTDPARHPGERFQQAHERREGSE